MQQIINESLCKDTMERPGGNPRNILESQEKKKAHPQYLISEHDYFPVVFRIYLDLG